MSYIYTTFEGVSLPVYDHSQNHSPMPADPALMDSIGGVFDSRGDGNRRRRKQTISAPGTYMGTTEYLADETGDIIVDETGDPIIIGSGKQILQAQIDDLMEKVGIKGTLWRERLVDGTLQWKTASLLDVSWPRKYTDHALKADLTCKFETDMQYWHVEESTVVSANLTNGVSGLLAIENVGQTVNDGVLTITTTSGTVTAVEITCVELGIDLEWAGSLANGLSLVIDCSRQTIPAAGVDSYSGFTRESGHTAAGWLPIPQGLYLLYVTVTGGNATASMEFYTQFP